MAVQLPVPGELGGDVLAAAPLALLAAAAAVVSREDLLRVVAGVAGLLALLPVHLEVVDHGLDTPHYTKCSLNLPNFTRSLCCSVASSPSSFLTFTI